MLRQMRLANTGDWALDLLAAIVQRAILDAQGNGERAEQAARWLDNVWPAWRRYHQRRTLKKGMDNGDRTGVSRPSGRTGRAQRGALLHTG